MTIRGSSSRSAARHGRMLLIVFACGAATAACTRMRVYKDSPAAPTTGFRYSLPKPVIVVIPANSPDGGFTAEVRYLPDDERTYTIDTDSVFAHHNVAIETTDRLLTKVKWIGEATAVPAAEFGAANAVLKAQADLRKTEKTKDAADKEAASDKVKTKRAEFTAAVATKETAKTAAAATVTDLTARIEALKKANPQDAGAISDAEKSLTGAVAANAKAVAEYNAAVAALAGFNSTHKATENAAVAVEAAGTASGANYNLASGTGSPAAPVAGDRTVLSVARGPILYALNETVDSRNGRPVVSLDAITYGLATPFPGAAQPSFPTAAVQKDPERLKAKVATPEPLVLRLEQGALKGIVELNVVPLSLTSQKLVHIDDATSSVIDLTPSLTLTPVAGTKQVDVRLVPASMIPGVHILTFKITFADRLGGPPSDAQEVKCNLSVVLLL
ncbi:MAG: hypothetical protein K8T90_15665 [Planctomycetes bacterium]|nr:hypothetical protein [Planctomycetota bacterium]